jgi:multidrug transporter EmrE-like cation transporter
MSLEITLVVLLAACMNAGWNAVIKVSGDRIAVMAVVTLFGSGLSCLALPFVVVPDPASWPLLGFAILLHTGYHFVLPLAYNHGDLGQVYPIARGSAPLLVALGAALFAGEMLSGLPLLGVVFLAVGVMALALDRGTGIRRNPAAVLLALGTGLFIAAYTLVDGLGARLAGSVLGLRCA